MFNNLQSPFRLDLNRLLVSVHRSNTSRKLHVFGSRMSFYRVLGSLRGEGSVLFEVIRRGKYSRHYYLGSVSGPEIRSGQLKGFNVPVFILVTGE